MLEGTFLSIRAMALFNPITTFTLFRVIDVMDASAMSPTTILKISAVFPPAFLLKKVLKHLSQLDVAPLFALLDDTLSIQR